MTRYLYDGEDVVREFDGAGALLASYRHGPGIDDPISMTRGGQTFYYHTDGLGSVVGLTNSSQAVVQTYEYDAFGNVLRQTGSVVNPYTYTGREQDAETGLYYYRARSYDPQTGRFLQEDPIGLAGGINLYAYVGNNPVLSSDPYGLFEWVNPIDYWGGFFGGQVDFLVNYWSMRKAGWMGGDKYFHCKANCQAAQRGMGGIDAACLISNSREWWDQNIKRSSAGDSAADQAANRYGRSQAQKSEAPCTQLCAAFRPPGLPPTY